MLLIQVLTQISVPLQGDNGSQQLQEDSLRAVPAVLISTLLLSGKVPTESSRPSLGGGWHLTNTSSEAQEIIHSGDRTYHRLEG